MVTLACFEEAYQESVCLVRLNAKLPAVQAQKNVGCEECHPFVAIKKRMVHQQRLEERGGHGGHVPVVACAWTEQSALEKA